jgi:hypothetical protein
MAAAGLSQRNTGIESNKAYKLSKDVLYLALRGMNHGVDMIRSNNNEPYIVEFNYADFLHDDMTDYDYYRSAPIWETPNDQNPHYNVKAFNRFPPPQLSGASISSNSGFTSRGWHLYVSAGIKIGEIDGEPIKAQKGLEIAVFFLSAK